MNHNHPIYLSFLAHLDRCGGCTGLRNQEKCKYAVVCAHVERMAKDGLVIDSEDFRRLER